MLKNVKGFTKIDGLIYNKTVETTLRDFLFVKLRSMEIEQGRKITNDEIAKVIRVDKSSVSNWINGKKFPSQENLAKLALFFGDEVLRFAEDDFDLDMDLVYINTYWPNLILADRQSIREQVERYLEKSDGQETVNRPTGADDLEKG